MKLHLKSTLITTALVMGMGLTGLPVQAQDLMDLYKEAYIQDTAVLQAKAQRDAAFAAIDQANAALLPQIDVVGSLTATHTSTYPGNYRGDNQAVSAGINLTQAIWRRSLWATKSIRVKQAAAADLQYNQALQYLIIRVANAYFDVLNASETLSFRKANRTALRQQLDEATRRFQVGLIAETDQLEAKAAYDLADAQVIAAENALSNSYEEIRALIGRPLKQLDPLDPKKFAAASLKQSLKQIERSALNNNLSLQYAVVQRDIARDNIALARTGHEPTLDLTGGFNTGYTHYNDENTSQHTGHHNSASIGLNLNVPIYHGGATQSQIEQAEHNYVAACESLEAQHRQILTDANNGFHNVTAAISSVGAYTQLVKSSRSALSATQAGYEVGTRTMTDVLDAVQTLYSAEQNLASARYSYIKSRLGLLYTEGQLVGDDLQQVNRALKPQQKKK